MGLRLPQTCSSPSVEQNQANIDPFGIAGNTSSWPCLCLHQSIKVLCLFAKLLVDIGTYSGTIRVFGLLPIDIYNEWIFEAIQRSTKSTIKVRGLNICLPR